MTFRFGLLLLLLTSACQTFRLHALPIPPSDAPRSYPAIVTTAQGLGYQAYDNGRGVRVILNEATSTELFYRVQDGTYGMLVQVDQDTVGDKLEQQLAWARSVGDDIFKRASVWFAPGAATPSVNVTIVNAANGTDSVTVSPASNAPPPAAAPPPLPPVGTAITAVEEAKDAWLDRRRGFSPTLTVGAGLSTVLGVELAFGLGRVSPYVMPQFQGRWPFAWQGSQGLWLLGLDAGAIFHLARRFSLGAGLLVGALPFGPEAVLGASVTPARLHLGARDQHQLSLYVPITFLPTSQPPIPLLMITYGYHFD